MCYTKALGNLLVFVTLTAFCEAQFNGETLKFKLSAVNLPNGDLDGLSDPYAMVFAATRRTNDRHRHWQYIGTTSTKQETLNPEWDEVFQYQYINGTNQMLRFFVKDQDDSWINPIYAIDDPLGRVDVFVEDYVKEMRKAKNQRINNSEPIKAIEMFLQHPIGGMVRVLPME